MKIAVLIVNYALIALMVLVAVTTTGQEAQSTVLGCAIILAAPILAVIYAHQQGGKK